MSRLRRYIASTIPPDPHAEARNRFLTAIEGKLLLDQIIREGINAYAHYVQHQIVACVSNSDIVLSEIYGSVPTGDRVSHLFDALVIVAEILHTLDLRSTLDDIAQQLLVKTYHLRKNQLQRVVGDQTLHGEHHIVFACLGWLSMLFIPFHDFSGTDFRLLDTVLMISPTKNSTQHKPDIHRPLGSMLRKMGLLPISCPAVPLLQKGVPESAPFIKLSVLCYASLHQIGEVSIIWVNNLVEHCHFDPERQELKVFRFPAHCLHAISGAPNAKILASILNAHTCGQPSKSCERDLPAVTQTYLREVLISYRVIFGQEKRSRKLFRSRQSSNARYRSMEDPILQALCGRKRTSLFNGYLSIDSEKEVFDAKLDFPHLGERLLQLHRYIANQTPSAWRSILLDRRNSRETFNFFWVVMVVGGISITLSFVQTVVAIVALARQLH